MAATRTPSGREPRQGALVAIVAVCALLGGIAGFAFYQVKTPVHSADTTVLVLPTAAGLDSSVDGSRVPSEVQIETEAEVASSASVAARAAELLEGPLTAETLLAGTTVTVSPNSQVLLVTFEAATAESARDGSQAMAQAYLDRRSEDSEAAINAARTTLQAANDEARKDLEKLATALDTPATTAQRSLLVAQIADLQSRLVALDVKTSVGGQIISDAPLPRNPVSPVLWIDVLAGVLIGGLIGSGIALLLSRRTNAGADAVIDLPRSAPSGAELRPAPVVVQAPADSTTTQPEPEVSTVLPPVVAPVSAESEEVSDAGTAPVLPVLASLEFTPAGAVADAQVARLRELCRSIAARAERPGPLVLVGVDYPVLMRAAAFVTNDAWAEELGGCALVFTEAGSAQVPGRPAVGGRGLTDVLSGEWPALDTISRLEGTGTAVMGHGQGNAELPPTTQRRRLDLLWKDLQGEFGAAIAQVQVPFDSTLAQTVMQTAGPVLIAVKVGLSQQQDLSYAVEQLTWLGLADRVMGVISVSGATAVGGGSAAGGGTSAKTARAKAKAAQAPIVEPTGDAPADPALSTEGAGHGST